MANMACSNQCITHIIPITSSHLNGGCWLAVVWAIPHAIRSGFACFDEQGKQVGVGSNVITGAAVGSVNHSDEKKPKTFRN